MRRRTSGVKPAGLLGRQKSKRRLGLETLETRELLATILVTNTNDSGAGSLRNAILVANAAPSSSVISFDIAAAGVQTIAPLTPLPTITNTLTIDATTQPGTGATPLIFLSGSNAGTGPTD